MKTMKILFGLLILVSLASCSAITTSDTHNNLSFHEISSPLKAVPIDYNKPDSGYFHLVETADGKSENLFSDFYIADPQHSIPIYKSSSDSYLLVYASEDLRTGYKLGSKKVIDDQTGGPLHDDDNDVIKEPVKDLSMLSVSYNPDLKTGDCAFLEVLNGEVPDAPDHAVLNNDGMINIDSTPNNISCDIEFASYFDASLKNGILTNLNNSLQVKEKYSHISASLNGNHLYSDHIGSNSEPEIYRTNELENDAGTLFKKNARHPVASDDDTIFAYSYSDNASFNDDCKWQTIIEKSGKQVKKFDTEQIVLMNEKGKTIYVIDPKSNVVQVLDMSSFNVVATGNIDKGFIFPQIYDGKLQYTCPVYKDGKIVNYIVKEESN